MIIIVKVSNHDDHIYKEIIGIAKKRQMQVETTECNTILEFPGLVIKPHQYQVLKGDREICLSSLEFKTLFYLARQPGRVFSHTQLYHAIYEKNESTEGMDNVVYCLIRSLRKKIETDPHHPRYICTVRGIGYKFAIPEA